MKRRIAIPTENGVLSGHFGHSRQFAFFETDDKKIVSEDIMAPPPHERGAIPKWLVEQRITDVIAGGIGEHAINNLRRHHINIYTGARLKNPGELTRDLLDGTLETGENYCDH